MPRILWPPGFLTFVWILLITGLVPRPATAQDTSGTTGVDVATDDHSPQGALWRAAVLPGWGQVYNRQYYKVPLVYLGLGGLTAAALYTNEQYLLYRHAFLYKRNQELVESGQLEENPWPQYEDEYRQLTEKHDRAEISAEPLRLQRDNLRRNRDLLYIGVGLWYGLSVLDAYVSAHLLDFDVSEDLTVSLRPDPTTGWTATVRIRY